jgi:hypothetical protein
MEEPAFDVEGLFDETTGYGAGAAPLTPASRRLIVTGER